MNGVVGLAVGTVGDDNVGVIVGSLEVHEERLLLAPRPDDDEPLDEFKFG